MAKGNVVFVSGDSRISSERADFDTRTRTGAFFNAFGSASVSQKVDKSFFGTQEPDAYFYGETIEKIGVDRYRITKRRLHDLRSADAALGVDGVERHARRSTSEPCSRTRC